MTGSVRENILDAIIAAVGTIPNLGNKPGGSEKAVFDAADVDTGTIVQIVQEGKRAVEIAFDDDVPEFDNGVDGADAFRFDVMLLMHLPESGPGIGSPSVEAARAYSDVHMVYAHVDDQTIGTWGGLATGTDNLGGGAVSYSGFGTNCVAAKFRVHYRHRTGDPQEAV